MKSQLLVLSLVLMLAPCAFGQEPITIKGLGGWVGALAFNPNGKEIAVGAGDGSVTLWDAVDGKKLPEKLRSHAAAVSCLAVMPDGNSIISGGHDGVVQLHHFQLEYRSLEFSGHAGAILSIALCYQDEKARLFTGGVDATIREWKYPKPLRQLNDHSSWVNGLAIDQGKTLLASASSDNTVQLRRLSDLKILHTFPVKEGEVRAVAFSPNGKLLAAGIRYGGVRVWDVETKKEVASLKAHAGETWAVAFTPDGKTLATGGGDWNKPGEVRLWEVATWKEQAKLAHTGEVLCLAISPDGRKLAAGGWDRTVRIWSLEK